MLRFIIVMLNVIMLTVVMLSVVMLTVVILSVVEPISRDCKKIYCTGPKSNSSVLDEASWGLYYETLYGCIYRFS